MENESELILYPGDDGELRIDVRVMGETVWLTQEQMASLFDRDRSVISKHIANVFKEGELDEESNVQILHIATSTKPVKLYNLDVIISVGYRVRSQQDTTIVSSSRLQTSYRCRNLSPPPARRTNRLDALPLGSRLLDAIGPCLQLLG